MSNRDNNNGKKVTVGRVYAISTILAFIIAIPAVAVTFVMHYVIKAEFFLTLAAGLITLFIAMGFGYKLSKKFVKVLSRDSE
jgi:membrane protein YdbS with pleckstrin-like domain